MKIEQVFGTITQLHNKTLHFNLEQIIDQNKVLKYRNPTDLTSSRIQKNAIYIKAALYIGEALY